MSLRVQVSAHAEAFRLDVAFESDVGTTAILGASGAGKTLTLRTIAGLLRPETGLIELDGRALFDSDAGTDVPARSRRVGYVFQDYALFPHLSVAENLAFGLRGNPSPEIESTVSRLIGLLRLNGFEQRRPSSLSGGERQRVALGRALAPGPALLLLDEPFSALDAPARAELTEDFLALSALLEVPSLLVTHDVAEAYALSQRIVVLGSGRVLQSGPREEVFGSPGSPEVARLVGVQNLIPGLVASVDGGLTHVDANGLMLSVSGPPFPVGTAVTAGMRAEDLRAAPGAGEGANGTFERLVDRGVFRSAVLRLDGGAQVLVALDRGGRSRSAETPGVHWRIDPLPGTAMLWVRE